MQGRAIDWKEIGRVLIFMFLFVLYFLFTGVAGLFKDSYEGGK
jgi:hypothetical protein